MKSRIKIRVFTLITAAAFLAVFCGLGLAALPAPNWMPGSPILAGNQVILLWTPVPGAVKYFVYMNGEKIQESVAIQVIMQAPEKAGTFEMQVSAVDASSVEGAKSTAGIFKIIKLVAPKGLNARYINKNVGMNWEPVGGAVLYNVYRKKSGENDFHLVESVQDVRYTDSKVENGLEYSYRVTAKDSSGKESPPSDPVDVAVKEQVLTQQKVMNVTGMKTKILFSVKDKDFTEKGIVKIYEPYDIEPSPDYSKFYVSSVHTRTVLIIDKEGNYIAEFGGGDPKRDGNFESPFGIGVAQDGKVYVVDSKKNNVQVFSPDGVFLKVFTTLGRKDWMKEEPRVADVDVDSANNVYLLEYFNAAVIKYNPKGDELSHIVMRTKEADLTGYTTNFKVIKDKIYIADGGRGRVVITDMSGKISKTVGVAGVGVGLFASMGGFDLGSDGLMYMTDRTTNLIQVYGLEDGAYKFTLASEDNKSPAPFTGPVALFVEADKKKVCVAMGMINTVRCVEMLGEAEEAKK